MPVKVAQTSTSMQKKVNAKEKMALDGYPSMFDHIPPLPSAFCALPAEFLNNQNCYPVFLSMLSIVLPSDLSFLTEDDLQHERY